MSEQTTRRVYVDAKPVDVSVSATVLDALKAADAALALAVQQGVSVVTDSRGLPISPDAPLHGGAILRVVAARKRES
jgi:hypothetical protein